MGREYSIENATVYAIEEGEKIGQISVPDIDFHWGEGCYVKMAGIAGVGTDPAYRTRGIASAMMKEAIGLAREKGYSCSGLSTNLGNISRRLYAKAGYTTLFKPGRFIKTVEKRECPGLKDLAVRPYREGDTEALLRLFEDIYSPYLGWRRKTVATWDALRSEVREKDPEFAYIAENEQGIQGWAGYFRQWVGLVGELHIRPSEGRTAIAQALLLRLENHLLFQGIGEAHLWMSPRDGFATDLLTGEGYTFREQRVFMLSILDLPNLLVALLPLFDRRLGKDSPWKGVMRIKSPVMEGYIRIDERASAEERGKPDAEVLMAQEALPRVLSGVLSPWEAYLEGLLTVGPTMTDELASLLKALFPEIPWYHPADDLW